MCPPRSGLLGVVDIELVSRLSAKAGITEGKRPGRAYLGELGGRRGGWCAN